MDHIVENDQKIRLVSMHLFGKALNWHKYFMSKYGEVMTWEVYQTHVQKRFEFVFEDPVVELKNLRQTTSVQVYQDSFEELLNKVDIKDTYAVSLFIGGLKAEIAYDVRMFKPTSLSDAFCLAKLQEANNSVTRGRPTPVQTVSKNVWLSTLGWIRCDFKNLIMEYTYKDKKVVLRGTQQDTIQWMQGKPKQGRRFMNAELSDMGVCICPATFMNMEAENSHSTDVKSVLEEFDSVFDVPKELPPKRTHDHRIPLVPNTPPVNIRP
ncbi:reverse transcriptase [Tanacetum coccineum]